VTTLALVDSYLAELAQHLPAPIREDVVSELREDLTQRVEDRAESKGRAPDARDERAVLGEMGHPLRVASRYGERRYLIGPELYPAYLQTLRTTVLCALVFVVVLKAVLGGNTDSLFSMDGLLGSLFEITLWVVGVVTVVFLIMESSGEKLAWYHDWTPDALHVGQVPVVQGDVATNFSTEVIFLLWWNSVLQLDWSLPVDVAESMVAPIIDALFIPLNVLAGLFVVVHGYVLLRGHWPRWASFVELGLCVALLVALGMLLRGQPLLLSPVEAGQDAAAVATIANPMIAVALWVVVGFTVWDAVLALGRLKR